MEKSIRDRFLYSLVRESLKQLEIFLDYLVDCDDTKTKLRYINIVHHIAFVCQELELISEEIKNLN